MIEGFGEELPENEMGDAIMEAHRLNQEVIALQKELAAGRGPAAAGAARDPARPAPRRPSMPDTATSSARPSRSS